MKRLICAAATAAALATPAAAAAKPVPCGPLPVQDPAGDQQMHVPQIGVPTGQDAEPLTDFTGFFFRGDGSKVSGNIMISELSKTVPEPATAVRWTLYYTVGEQGYYARVILNSDGVKYVYGTENATTGSLTEVGPMKGEFHEGKDGIISFVLPAAAGGKPGTKVTKASAIAAYQFPQGAGSSADFMPDEDEFEATVPTCPADAAPAPGPGTDPGTSPDPAPAPGDPAPAPAPGGQPAPAPATPGATQRDFRIGVKPATLKARKLKKRKAITFTLTSGETVTAVTAKLVKGKKVLGTGKLARLAGRGKLKLKPKSKPRKGAYTLVITGKRADGSTGTVGVKIRIR